MSINLGDFVSHLKREGQIGDINVTSDQTTADILSSINKRATRIWARADWKWYKEPLAFTLVANQRQYAVAAIAAGKYIDSIRDLIPYDPTNTFLQGKPLDEHTDRDFYARVTAPRWQGNTQSGGQPAWNVGFPTDYHNIGIDANGNWNIIVDPVPNQAGRIGGFGKAIMATLLNADIVANNPIPYFPNGVILDSLYEGVMSDIMRLRGLDIEAIRLDQSFNAKVKTLAGEQLGVAEDNTPPTTRLPPTVARLRRRGRRNW